MPKTKVGYMDCETCSERVTVKVNENDTLSYRCDECDAAPYARPKTKQHSTWLLKVAEHPDNATQPVKPAIKQTGELPKTESKAPDLAKQMSNIWGV